MAWNQFLRHGTEPTLAELENYTFESVVFEDGTLLKNVTFDELATQVWSLVSRSADPGWSNDLRNTAAFSGTSRSANPSWASESRDSASWAEQNRN